MSLVGASPALASWQGRDFLKEIDHTGDQLLALVALAAELKAEKREHREQPRLLGRNVALVFEKTSTRTRCAFEVGAHDQGAATTYLDPAGSQIGHKESVADTAKVLARMFDAIQYRGASQAVVDELAAASDVPVYNGLTDEWHPTQMLADLLTMLEHSRGPAGSLSYAYLGDARFNTGRSLLVTGALVGADVRLVAPAAYWPDSTVVTAAREVAAKTGARLTLTEDLDEGLRDAEFVHTDVWVSMGEPAEVWEQRIEALAPYQVNASAMARTSRVDSKFLHCLPAYHDRGTVVGRTALDRFDERFGLHGGLEVTDEVFQSPANVCFDQAENRLHTIKALMVATLA
jgi:ornithine carbamoyltransferase